MAINVFLLKKRSLFWQLDVYPFLFLYISVIILGFFYIEEDIISKLAFITILLIHAMTYIMGHWSPRCRSYIKFNHYQLKASINIHDFSHVKVIYKKKELSSVVEICPLQISTYGDAKKGEQIEEVFHFSFHYRKFVYDEKNSEFYRIKPSIKQPLSYYQENIERNALYDANELDITIRNFAELLKDQLMEPFSFFQFFSVSLWLVDENRFFAIFTLFLLFFLGCITVIQRIRTMIMYRQMRLNPQYIHVYRDNKWVRISSHDLEPGDICMISAGNSCKKVEEKNIISDEEFLRQQIPYANKLPGALFKTEKVNSESHKLLPCDFLLLNGGCVVNESVLTGESIPQIKDSIERSDVTDILDVKNKHKNSVLFCGTEVLQIFPNEKLPSFIKVAPPSGSQCCLAYALRTGFDTSKGKLIRTVIFNNENILTKQTDAFIIIGILLIFSIISSVNILIHGLADPTRDRNKLFLRCILIITTVVPPELPMILNIAVNGSIMLLQRKKIFCTEPYRMPLAGKISICAFDKTGTLTSDELVFHGIVDDTKNYKNLKQFEDVNNDLASVLAGCHSLIFVDKKLVGDPIETLFFNASQWDYSSLDKTARNKKNETTLRIKKIFPFRSDLKRMSTIVNYEKTGSNRINEYRLLCKGAPEILSPLFKEIPENYKEAYEYYTKKGLRVLALGYTILNEDEGFSDKEREELEKDLKFAGFFICDSPLKKDTKAVIEILQQAKLKIVMITGDNHLTACKIARELDMGPYKYLYLSYKNEKFYWIDESDESKLCDFSEKSLINLQKTHTLCITGDMIKILPDKIDLNKAKALIRSVIVFARTSPSQKEYIIYLMKSNGADILMCGDGTNDVGALKKAEIGIALVGLKDAKEKAEKKIEKDKKKKPTQNDELFEMPQYKQGDACIAAPFTSKHSNSIRCVLIILRQGICTLVTTMQTYKILTLSSLISAYSLSSLHFQSLKFSETQSTIIGISGALNYYFFSNTKPLKKISEHRPVKSIMEIYFIISVVGQTLLHLYGISYVVKEIGIHYTPEKDLNIKNDEEFIPTFCNTVVFLFSLISQTSIFLFNHAGEPHMESLSKNSKHLKSLIVPLIVGIALIFNASEDISYMMELNFNGIPFEANLKLFYVSFVVVVGTWVLEKGLKFIKYGKIFDLI